MLIFGLVIILLTPSVISLSEVIDPNNSLDQSEVHMRYSRMKISDFRFNENPDVVYVDDDFNSSTSGWGYDHFNMIQNGIDAVAENGIVNVYNGTYIENILVNKTIILKGEHNETTIIDGNGTGDVVTITANQVSISGFTIKNSGTTYFDSGIKISSSNNNTITNNIIINDTEGVYFSSSKNNTITENTLSNYSSYGVQFYFSNKNILSNNIFSNGQIGLGLLYSSENTIHNNNFLKNDKGCLLALPQTISF